MRLVTARDLILHGGVLVALVGLAFVLPEYHQGNVARILVLATFAMGYNVAFGYTGLLGLGHAMFFAAGIYGAALPVQALDWPAWAGFVAGIVAATALSGAAGLLALRTAGVSFMIVTLMFAQAAFLTVLYFGEVTRGDEGFVIPQADRSIGGLDLSDPDIRYFSALALFGCCMCLKLWLVRSSFGRVMVAMRENEPRARMLGYDPFTTKLYALMASGAISGAAGAAYALLFGYAGATFASIQYSILPLLWVLLGGAGTVLGPFLGTGAMFYLVDLTSSVTDAYLAVVGAVLVVVVLFARKGVLGTIRERWVPWLP